MPTKDWVSILVTEALRPSETSYGTDYENGRFYNNNNIQYLTLFESDGIPYIFNLAGGNVGFAVLSEKKTLSQLMQNPLELQRMVSQGSLGLKKGYTDVFNKVFFILKRAVDEFGIDKVGFSSGDDKLKRFYDIIVNNGKLQELVNSMGFDYVGEEEFPHRQINPNIESWHVFKKR